jgi:hypothetical protein
LNKQITSVDCHACEYRKEPEKNNTSVQLSNGYSAYRLPATTELMITTPTGSKVLITGKAGDWLVTAPEGNSFIVSNDDYLKRFSDRAD